MKRDIFDVHASTAPKGYAGILDAAKQMVNQAGHRADRAVLTQNVMALESLQPAVLDQLGHSVQDMFFALEGFCKDSIPTVDAQSKKEGREHQATASQLRAATFAGMMGGDLKAALRGPVQANVLAVEGRVSVVDSYEQGLESRTALEAYDEQNTNTSVAFSIGYNLGAARQDDFSETLFPTVVIPPDQAGMYMSIDLVMLQADAKRQMTGVLADFQRYNVIRAITYPQLLQTDATDCVPVYRDESAQFFVSSTTMAPKNVILTSGESVPTSALKMGAEFDLLALSQTDTLLQAGLADLSDSIDTGVTVTGLYLQLTGTVGGTATTNVIRFDTTDMQFSNFTQAQQGNYRDMILNFDVSTLLVNNTTTQFDGSPATLLSGIGAYEVRLSNMVAGKMNLQFGKTTVYSNQTTITNIRVEGTPGDLDPTVAPGSTIAAMFAGATLIGYDLSARRSNMNRRQRGQIVDTTTYRQYYKVPLLSPVTVPRPHAAGDINDARDLNALIFTTRVRTTNAGIAKLISTADLLKSVYGQQNRPGDTIETLGLARYLLDPYYEEQVYNAPDVVDSIKSHERAADIQASLVNMIRDMVYRAYSLTGYKPAADSQNGGMSAPPTVIIATDQIIHRYLMVTGDLRTLGDQFPVKIVSTPNETMRGQIYITFGDMATAEAGVPNVLHFGTMQYRPEMTVILPTYRDGANSKEITVMPSFQHHVNLPILMKITVTNIADVVSSKVTINTHAIV